jgi:ABC-type multidrug transport system fused ATPase/permease subunit
MLFFKSAFNGIGSAAGVAWPFFGIVFSAVGSTIGGPVSLILGSFAMGLFVLIGLSIAYFSYQQMQQDKKVLHSQLLKNEEKFTNALEIYINQLKMNYAIFGNKTDFNQYLDKLKENPKHTSLQQVLLNYQIALQQNLPPKEFILQNLKNQYATQQAPYSQALIPAFFSFVGTFGSIAGCSAGVSGLLTGVGLFSSFTAFPLLGGIIISVAIGTGLYLAIDSFIDAQDIWVKNKINQEIKNTSKQLGQITFSHATTEEPTANKVPKYYSPLFQPQKINNHENYPSHDLRIHSLP